MTKNQRNIQIKPSPFIRGALLAGGMLSTGLGVVGIFVPILPTTPFLLLAAACFIRSSDKFYSALVGNRFLGQYIKNYREQRAMPLKLKILTIYTLWLTIGFSIVYATNELWLRVGLAVVAVAVTIHVAMLRKVKKTEN